MQRSAVIFLCLLLALWRSAAAGTDCDGGWVCVEVEESTDGVVVSGHNLSDFPLTLTVRLHGTGLRLPSHPTVTRTLAGGDRREFLRVPVAKSGESYDYRYRYDWALGDRRARHDDGYLYRLPYAAGASFPVLQGYGSRFSHTGLEHYAVDFDMPEGTAVHAARGGVVARIEESHDRGCWEAGCGRYANYIVILHDDGTTGEYYHLQQQGALVTPGQRISAGDLIGRSGSTGHSTMPHLHFAVYRAGEWGHTHSVPVRFRHRDGVVAQPRHGQRLVAD